MYTWETASAFTLLAIPLAINAELTYRRLRWLPSFDSGAALPSLTIIIPARNESANLHQLGPSLAALRYPGPIEVIVVDDNSTDDTAALAENYGASVLRLTELPEGWKGKPNACHQGAARARCEWLLFTDADTLHAADGPARAVTLAQKEGLDGLSLLPPVRYFGLTDRLALTTAFAGLFAMGAPQAGMLNGQFVLLRRDVYDASGGFGAVRDEALEDVALGHRLAALGYQVPMVHGGDALQVAMYGDAQQMWRGLTRLGQGALRWWGLRALLTAVFITAVLSPLVAITGWAAGQLPIIWPVATWAVATAAMLSWTRRTGHPADAFLSPIGSLIMMLAALWGALSRMLGIGISWKGRRV
jgi:cellulose synthase/poly-beta-1,6-N-acetylglucosamine synthase-like glycosyltransferase